jgi:hypothetical protein
MNDIPPELGGGKLRKVIKAAKVASGLPMEDLTVLAFQHDPYRLDTQAGHRDGKWMATQFDRVISATYKNHVHLRGLHYALVAIGDVRKPNGNIYLNTFEDWAWLQEKASKRARWLGYVPFSAIVDQRNSPPVIYEHELITTPYRGIASGINLDLPSVDGLDPRPFVLGFECRQPYHLVIFGEKSSIGDVVLPLAREFEADVYLPNGEISDTMLHQMAKTGAEDERPMVVFVIADFDPGGHQMAISIGRKL